MHAAVKATCGTVVLALVLARSSGLASGLSTRTLVGLTTATGAALAGYLAWVTIVSLP